MTEVFQISTVQGRKTEMLQNTVTRYVCGTTGFARETPEIADRHNHLYVQTQSDTKCTKAANVMKPGQEKKKTSVVQRHAFLSRYQGMDIYTVQCYIVVLPLNDGR